LVFAAWGSWVARFRWPVLICTVVAVAAAGMWGLGVFGQLTEGGYQDPGSESARAADVVRTELGAQGGDVVVIYTPATGGINDAALGRRVQDRLAALPASSVTAIASYWPDRAPQYASADGKRAVAVLTLAGADDGEKLEAYREIDDKLAVEGATTQLAGGAPLGDASSTLSTQDLAFAEAVSLPIVLILLLLIFGSLVAASLPVLVGGCAVLGSLGVLHAIAYGADVNSFAVNVASLLGLGMAIDYGLFMVGRFREEQGFGRTPAEAVKRTVATAGRTVVFSATLLMIALAGLLLFPQGFLKSLAYGGLASVALAAVLSLTLLPAVLAVLGPRVDKLPVRLPRRAKARPAGTGWARLAGVVLRRPVLVALPILAVLLVLAAPILGVRFGDNDERILPAGNPARQAIETLKTDFPALSSAGIQVVLRGTQGDAPAAAAGTAFAAEVEKIPGIAAVAPAGSGGDVLLYTATLTGTDPFSTAARDAVADLRALSAPAGTEVLVGGTTAGNVDSLAATAEQLPLMVSLLVGATLVLMFLAFGSILLPVKAVLLSALSLCATFGVLVWIFQDGHGAALLQVTPAPPEAGIVVLMAAVVFGLSTDYEVFLLSRMVEARTRGASTAEAVTTGLARTGRVISAAAILLIVVTGAFALSSVTTMRFIGVGMIVALFLDATVVRMLLVPAVLKLMGDAAWWAPGPLRRLQERAGLQEYEDEELFPTVSVGRHAAPSGAGSGFSGSGFSESGFSGSGLKLAASGAQAATGARPVAAGSASVPASASVAVTAGARADSGGQVAATVGSASVPASVAVPADAQAASGSQAASVSGRWPMSAGSAGSVGSVESEDARAEPADAPTRHTSWFGSPAGASGETAPAWSPTGSPFPAGSPVPGAATTGYPVAGSAPHPSPSRITLDEPGTGSAPWLPGTPPRDSDTTTNPQGDGSPDQPATVDLSDHLTEEPAAGSRSAAPSRTAGDPAAPDWSPVTSEQSDSPRGASSSRGASEQPDWSQFAPEQPDWSPIASEQPDWSRAASGRAPVNRNDREASDRTEASDHRNGRSSDRKEPGADTTAVLELPPPSRQEH
jgi:uncharacterized membrane protein YdfJ with MMPL/SSD domain